MNGFIAPLTILFVKRQREQCCRHERKNASIQLKLSKAQSLLAEVDVLMEHQFYITAINRLYYACYHATKALLLTGNIIPQTHSGVLSQLHRHFVKEGLFDFEQASFFSRLMQERIEDDYSDSIVRDENEVKDFIEPARSYISYTGGLVKRYLEN